MSFSRPRYPQLTRDRSSCGQRRGDAAESERTTRAAQKSTAQAGDIELVYIPLEWGNTRVYTLKTEMKSGDNDRPTRHPPQRAPETRVSGPHTPNMIKL